MASIDFMVLALWTTFFIKTEYLYKGVEKHPYTHGVSTFPVLAPEGASNTDEEKAY